MCICGGVCETVAVVAVGGYIVRKLTRKRPPQMRPACFKCGSTQHLMYNSYYCSDCYYGILDTMQYEKGCNDASPDR